MSANETSVGTSEACSDGSDEIDKTLLINVPSIAFQHLQGFAAQPTREACMAVFGLKFTCRSVAPNHFYNLLFVSCRLIDKIHFLLTCHE